MDPMLEPRPNNYLNDDNDVLSEEQTMLNQKTKNHESHNTRQETTRIPKDQPQVQPTSCKITSDVLRLHYTLSDQNFPFCPFTF